MISEAQAQKWLKKLSKKPMTMYAAAKRVGEGKRTVQYDASYRFKEWVWKELAAGRLELTDNREIRRS